MLFRSTELLGSPLFGIAADHVGRKPIMLLGPLFGLAAVCVVGVLAYGLLGAALRIVNISELRFVMRRQPGVRPAAPDEQP